MSTSSDHVAPPRNGKLQVNAVSAVGVLNVLVNDDDLEDNDHRSQYYTFTCDVDCSITFRADDKGITDPDPTAVAGVARTFVMSAGTEYHWYITDQSRFFDHLGSAAGFLRWWRS